MKNSKRKGFTLIELLVVISIVGLLSSVILNATQSAREKARNKQRLQQIDQIEKAFSIYMTLSDTTKLPTTNYSGGRNFCLGQGGYYSANHRQCDPAFTTAPGPITVNTTIDTALSSVLAAGVIPSDPYIKSRFGNSYQYNSDISPATLLGGSTFGECTATTCPRGAYLFWVIEKSSDCGRGYYADLGSAPNEVYNLSNTVLSACYLRIGDAS